MWPVSFAPLANTIEYVALAVASDEQSSARQAVAKAPAPRRPPPPPEPELAMVWP